ncbi:DUF418 domain-containing protein [uncultured Corynebacterium sp.]|uniref:DUF418 domain-containing protein n=1 Tax=uncultured Corynebacterium sp. TaxID=159447 RepID=UPI0025DD2E3B|nr:DUF418 domain-containing protein [uncultured Corynebacterium sp.]
MNISSAPNERTTSTATSQSTTPPGRLDTLDAIRGLAVCGIAFVNAPSIWHLMIDPDYGPNHVRDLLDMFVQQRFFPIFSLLFGVGFGLLWRSARTRTERPRLMLVQRFGFLLALGVAHQIPQPGEALAPYAAAALLGLIPATFLPTRYLAPASAIGGAILFIIALIPGGGIITIPGLFLLGLALTLYDVPRLIDSDIRVNALTLLIAAPLSAAVLWWQNTDQTAPGFSASSAVAGALMAVTYMAFVAFLMSTPLRAAVAFVLTPMGRMSLTNYVGATVLFVVVRDALPLFGVVDDSPSSWAGAMAVVAGILVVQWLFSVAWLSVARQGPLEWVWRKVSWAGH